MDVTAIWNSSGETDDDPIVGAILESRYRVLRRIGGGGMGTVVPGAQCSNFMTRFYGVLAPHAENRKNVVSKPDVSQPPQLPLFGSNDNSSSEEPPKKNGSKLSWGKLLARVFNIDVTICPKCNGPMKILDARRSVWMTSGIAGEHQHPITETSAVNPTYIEIIGSRINLSKKPNCLKSSVAEAAFMMTLILASMWEWGQAKFVNVRRLLEYPGLSKQCHLGCEPNVRNSLNRV